MSGFAHLESWLEGATSSRGRRRSPAVRSRRTRSSRAGSPEGTAREPARVEVARSLAEAIWHMLTRNQPFAPAGAFGTSVA